jgi:hypothetical protein
MIYNKNNLIIAGVADKKSQRAELSGVLFKRDRTAATDSYKLVEVKNPPEMVNSVSDYPILTEGKTLKDYAKSGYIIPANSVKKAIKNLAEVKNKNLTVLEV